MPEPVSEMDNQTTSAIIEVPIINQVIKASDVKKSVETWSNKSNSGPIKILDPGFQVTAVMETSVSEIDQITGDIRYRGHSIRDLIEKYDFDDVVHLLIFGRLPTSSEKTKLRECIASQMDPPKIVVDTIRAMSKSAPTFTMLMTGLTVWNAQKPDMIPVAVSGLTYHKHPINLDDSDDSVKTADAVYRTLAAMAVVVALVSCHLDSIEFTKPDSQDSFASNILRMCGKLSGTEKDQLASIAALNKILIISADHEMTNSTSAFLHATSSGADPLSASVSAIASAFGPLHAGAIQMAYEQFEGIGSPENVPKFIEKIKLNGARIAGLGHRIWKDIEDPRLGIVRTILKTIPGALSHPLVAIALEIDKCIANDSHFTDRSIKPNVDLFNCFAYTALGFKPTIGPLIATYARITGGLAHWQEQLSQPPCLWRPTAVFKEDKNAAANDHSAQPPSTNGINSKENISPNSNDPLHEHQ